MVIITGIVIITGRMAGITAATVRLPHRGIVAKAGVGRLRPMRSFRGRRIAGAGIIITMPATIMPRRIGMG